MRMIDDDQWKPVITTRQVLEDGEEIVCVNLDAEGDWEAFGDSDFCDDDLDAVSISEIMEIDPSLETLPDMPCGQSVIRLGKGSPWCVVDDSEA